mmetsp:Transcript_28097/g.86136  ORF Transcript_28097/g.86136 Transcript_28097/m.86136 type:complete len:97 (-) Transcript_28097:1300-1590(-)
MLMETRFSCLELVRERSGWMCMDCRVSIRHFVQVQHGVLVTWRSLPPRAEHAHPLLKSQLCTVKIVRTSGVTGVVLCPAVCVNALMVQIFASVCLI